MKEVIEADSGFVSLIAKVFDGLVKNLEFNFRLHQKPISVLV